MRHILLSILIINHMTDLRTPLQKARAERAERVCEMFNALKKDVVGSDTAIIEHIANVLKGEGDYITSMGVRYILRTKKLI